MPLSFVNGATYNVLNLLLYSHLDILSEFDSSLMVIISYLQLVLSFAVSQYQFIFVVTIAPCTKVADTRGNFSFPWLNR